MSSEQKEWARSMGAILRSRSTRKPNPPEGKGLFAKLRRKCYKHVAGDPGHAATFEKSVAGLVILNVFSMAITWYDQPGWVDTLSLIHI